MGCERESSPSSRVRPQHSIELLDVANTFLFPPTELRMVSSSPAGQRCRPAVASRENDGGLLRMAFAAVITIAR